MPFATINGIRINYLVQGPDEKAEHDEEPSRRVGP